MTISEFVRKWDGKFLEYDGAYKNQCVDLTKAWQANLGLKVTTGNAKNWLKNASRSDYEVIYLVSGQVVQPGDIVVFGTLYGEDGHVGICTERTALGFKSFEQNNPKKSACHIVDHPAYNGVLGWLRPKKGVGVDQCFNERMNARADAMRFTWESWNPGQQVDMSSIYKEATLIEQGQLNQQELIGRWKKTALDRGYFKEQR